MAGLHPNGVKALGSRIVAFSNSEATAGVVKGSLAGFVAGQTTGQPKWLADFGSLSDVSNQVNDIAIKGAKVAAAGYRVSMGYKWTGYAIYSTVNGVPGEGAGMDNLDNEALAVSWVGAYLAIAASSKAIVAVGHATDGSTGKPELIIQGCKP